LCWKGRKLGGKGHYLSARRERIAEPKSMGKTKKKRLANPAKKTEAGGGYRNRARFMWGEERKDKWGRGKEKWGLPLARQRNFFRGEKRREKRGRGWIEGLATPQGRGGGEERTKCSFPQEKG